MDETTDIDVGAVSREVPVSSLDAGAWAERNFPAGLRSASINGLELYYADQLSPDVRRFTTAAFPISRESGSSVVTLSRAYRVASTAVEALIGGPVTDEAMQEFIGREQVALLSELNAIVPRMVGEINAALPQGTHVVDLDAREMTLPFDFDDAAHCIAGEAERSDLRSLHPLSEREGHGVLIVQSGNGVTSVTQVSKAGTVMAPDGVTQIGTVLHFGRRVTADVSQPNVRRQLDSQQQIRNFKNEQQRQFGSYIEVAVAACSKALTPLQRPSRLTADLSGL